MKSFVYHIFVSIVMLIIASTSQISFLFAQAPNIQFELITTRDGLPSNTVFVATKDNKGFMWFGTRRCATRYDGYSFRNFTNVETSLVLGIAADHDNNIFLATDLNGACKIEANTLKMSVLPAAHQHPVKQSAGTFIDSKGFAWYSDWYGFHRLDTRSGAVKHYPMTKTNYVWTKASFAEDNSGNIWIIGSDNGLFQFDHEKETMTCVLGAEANIESRRFPILFTKGFVDDNNVLWVGTYNYGLLKYNVDNDDFDFFTNGLNTNSAQSIAQGFDEKGNEIIWFGDNTGLGVFRPEQQRFYYFENLLPDSYVVHYIFRDQESGIVWVCTDEGVLKYNPTNNLIQTILIPKETLKQPSDLKVFFKDRTDPSGNTIYIGASDGLIKWNVDRETFTHIPFPGNETRTEVKWMIQHEDGNIYIGANKWNYLRPGIFIFDPRNKAFLNTPQIIKANTYFSVPFFMYGFFDNDANLWIGNSDEGIRIIDPLGNEITPIDSINQIPQLLEGNNLINHMILDNQGKSWYGTYSGLYYLDVDKSQFVFADISDDDFKLQDPTINSLYIDSRKNIWAARWGSITVADSTGGMVKLITTKDGLFDRENKGIVEDGNGNFWFGNFEGLHHYIVDQDKLMGFTVNEGLVRNNTLDRLFMLNDNQLIIGQRNGFNILDTEKIFSNYAIESIEISSFKIHNRPHEQDFSKEVILPRFQNSFNIDFVNLSYNRTDHTQYAYYLENWDTDWIYSGNYHIANYSNLSPGKYVLHIKAGNAFGEFHEYTRLIPIRVLPAFYETWWFRTVAFLVLLSFLYGLYRYRIAQLLKLQQIRNRISADLHDEIGSSLSAINIMGSMAGNNLDPQHPSSPFIQKIREDITQINVSLDDIVWSVNPKNDDFPSLLARMTRYASELMEAKNIQFNIHVPEVSESYKLSMEQRKNFYLIFKEAINNITKHSECTEASLEIEITNKTIKMSIADNGKGFDTSLPNFRNGLVSMKRRADDLHGTLTISSELRKGTRIALEFSPL
jgi:signal transduction histidine kinase/ligand-binding sensor domain-containing protein